MSFCVYVRCVYFAGVLFFCCNHTLIRWCYVRGNRVDFDGFRRQQKHNTIICFTQPSFFRSANNWIEIWCVNLKMYERTWALPRHEHCEQCNTIPTDSQCHNELTKMANQIKWMRLHRFVAPMQFNCMNDVGIESQADRSWRLQQLLFTRFEMLRVSSSSISVYISHSIALSQFAFIYKMRFAHALYRYIVPFKLHSDGDIFPEQIRSECINPVNVAIFEVRLNYSCYSRIESILHSP